MKTKDRRKAVRRDRKVGRTVTKPQVAKPEPKTEDILGSAMLVHVNIKYWDGRKRDADVTRDTNERHKANADAGAYWKRLLGGNVPEHNKVDAARHRLRQIHYQQTLPWANDGARLLPSANYFDYTQQMRQAINDYNNSADEFEQAYSKLVKAAEARLGTMFRSTEYPSAQSIRRKFRAALEFSPVPASGDFRLSLPKEELNRMGHEVEDRVKKSVTLAMEEAWRRLGDAITKIRDKLDDGKYLRDEGLENLRDVAGLLGRLNLLGDENLEAARKQVMAIFDNVDAGTLKKDETTRANVARQADEILKSMQGVYSSVKDDDEEEE